MTCEDNCGVGCPNFYVEDGVHGCLKGDRTSFRAAVTEADGYTGDTGSPMDQLQKQFNEVFKVVNRYRRVRIQARKAEVALLQSRVRALIAKTRSLILQEQYQQVLAARHQELTMRVPIGYMSDLGYKFSIDCLEQLSKATATDDFDSYQDYAASMAPYRNSLLANPAKMAALVRAAYE